MHTFFEGKYRGQETNSGPGIPGKSLGFAKVTSGDSVTSSFEGGSGIPVHSFSPSQVGGGGRGQLEQVTQQRAGTSPSTQAKF